MALNQTFKSKLMANSPADKQNFVWEFYQDLLAESKKGKMTEKRVWQIAFKFDFLQSCKDALWFIFYQAKTFPYFVNGRKRVKNKTITAEKFHCKLTKKIRAARRFWQEITETEV